MRRSTWADYVAHRIQYNFPPMTARVPCHLLILALAVLGAGALRCGAEELTAADHLVVHKAERKLYLYHGQDLLGSYRISLGLHPVGHKEREHDYRTPEGHYELSQRNTRSSYFLSILVSYPNSDDVRRARQRGWAAGGSIMIHGFPNSPSHSSAVSPCRIPIWSKSGCVRRTIHR